MLTTETDRINKNGNFNPMLILYETNTSCPPSGRKKIDASYNLIINFIDFYQPDPNLHLLWIWWLD
jgi:hypothetical protein